MYMTPRYPTVQALLTKGICNNSFISLPGVWGRHALAPSKETAEKQKFSVDLYYQFIILKRLKLIQ